MVTPESIDAWLVDNPLPIPVTEAEVTEAEAWARCPDSNKCRGWGMKHPRLECWDEAGDIVASLRLKRLLVL
jgi:hypothetical protein